MSGSPLEAYELPGTSRGTMVDGFIVGTMDWACDAIRGAGANKLWADLCLNPQGGDTLYYAVIAFYVVVALAILGAIGNRITPKSNDRLDDREEPR